MEEISRAVYALLGYYVSPSYDRATSDEQAKKVFAKLDPRGKGFVSKEDFVKVCSEVRNEEALLLLPKIVFVDLTTVIDSSKL